MVIYGLLDTCSFMFSKLFVCFSIVSLKKGSLKISVRLLYRSSRVFEKLLSDGYKFFFDDKGIFVVLTFRVLL